MLDLMMSWAAEAFADLLEMVIPWILEIFGFNFDSFARAFPFAATAYHIFQQVGLSFALIIAGWHLVPFVLSWFGIQINQLKSTPMRQLFQCMLSVIMIYYGNYLLEGIINIAQYPFDALLYAENDPSWSIFQFDIGSITSPLKDLFAGTSVLLYLILLLLIGFNLIKVLLEAVERYVVLFVLIYLSPLAASTLASEETSGIYKRFFIMFMSQCLLLLLNVWTMKMAISMFSSLGANDLPLLGLLMGYAFLRIALRMDSYLNQLGLNSAVTGAGLGMELMATGATIIGGLSKYTGIGSSGGSAGLSESPVLGVRDGIAGFVRRWSPAAGLGASGEAALHGVGHTARSAYANGVQAYRSTGDFLHAAGEAGQTVRNDIGNNVASSINGSDNFITRQTSRRRTQAAAVDFATGRTPDAGGTRYTENQAFVSNNAHSAAMVMSAFEADGHTTSEPKTVTSVLEGIGARNANPVLKNFINVGNGTDQTIRTGSAKFTLDKSGISASYIKNGSTETLELHTASQYNALNENEQKTFQQFNSQSGDTFYYRTTSAKKPASP